MAIEDDGKGAAGNGGDGKGGAGAGGAGAAQGGASGEGDGKSEERSLVGGAGLPKDDKGGDGKGAGDGNVEGDDAAKKVEADKQARAALEKELSKELEGKTDDEKKAILDKKMAEQAKGKEGAPAEYANFKLPEGMGEIDKGQMDEFKALAKTHNLSQEAAQGFVDLQAKIEKSRADAAVAEFDKVTKAWRDETVKELGANFEAETANVGRFIERFGSPELRKLMDATHIGENKHLFTALAKAGAQIGEGNLPKGGKGGGKEDQGKTWYPNMREQMDKGSAK